MLFYGLNPLSDNRSKLTRDLVEFLVMRYRLEEHRSRMLLPAFAEESFDRKWIEQAALVQGLFQQIAAQLIFAGEPFQCTGRFDLMSSLPKVLYS